MKTPGEQLALDGMELALSTDHGESWRDRSMRHVSSLPAGTVITSETLIDALGEPTEGNGQNANNSVGATMRALRAAGLIAATGHYVKATRPSAHARIIATWRVQ